MAYEIVWTPTAKEDFREIVDYLYDNWSLQVAESFVDSVYEKIDLLKTTPFIGQASQKVSFVRRLLLTKHNGLFYRVVGQEVILLNILNLSGDPEANPY